MSFWMESTFRYHATKIGHAAIQLSGEPRTNVDCLLNYLQYRMYVCVQPHPDFRVNRLQIDKMPCEF